MYSLLSYAMTAGESGSTPVAWPIESGIPLDAERPTLIVFAHPRCPCTRATLSELSVLATHCQDRLTAHVLFFAPSTGFPNWTDTDLWRTAASIPHVQVAVDVDGAEARRFGALTSGLVVLYSPSGRLLFHGGITSARGHAGDNPGRLAIELALLEGKTPRSEVPVFGCRLLGPEPSR